MKKRVLYRFFCLLIVCFPLLTPAQTHSYSFTNYTTANGLCYNYVFDILQDSRGFMWFGTAEGLSRFEGSNFNFFLLLPIPCLPMILQPVCNL